MIKLNIRCDKCGKAMDMFDNVYCAKCYIAIQEELLLEITKLKDKIEDLEYENKKLRGE